MNCTYTLRIGNRTHDFNSETELDDFIRKNSKLFKNINQFSDLVFDEKAVRRNIIRDTLLNANIKGASTNYYNGTTQQNEVSTATRQAVTKAIGTWTLNGKPVCKIYDEENWEKNTKKLLIAEGKSVTEAEQEIETLKHQNKVKALMGEKVHKVAELFFDPTFDNQLINDYVDLPRPIISGLVKGFSNLKSTIQGADEVYFVPEMTLQTEEGDSDPIIGRVDLIAVKDNEVSIYDFKVSTNKFEDWDYDKKKLTDLQLASYRGLLAHLGVPPKNISLYVVPIWISEIDFDAATFNKFEFQNIQNRTLSNPQDLAFPFGRYTRIVNHHIKPKVSALEATSELVEKVGSLSEAAFGKITSITPEDFIKKYVKRDPMTNEFYFLDFITKIEKDEEIRITAKSIDEIKPKVLEYLQLKEIYDQGGYYIQVYKEMKKLLNSSKSLDEVNVFGKRDSRAKAYLTTVFSSYLDNPAFELIDSIPELMEMGMYLFLDKEAGIVHVVALTNNDLKQELKLNYKYNSILANLMSSAKSEKMRNILSGTVGNAKMMEVLFALNEVSDQLSAYKIGDIRVINHREGQGDYASIPLLEGSFRQLCKALNVDNRIGSTLTFADPIIAIQSALIHVLNADRTETSSAARSIYDLYSTNNIDTMTGEMKIEMLRKMQEVLKQSTYSVSSWATTQDFSNPYVRMYHELNKLILHYQNVYFNMDRDLVLIDVNFNPLKDTFGLTGYAVSNPDVVDNPIMAEITRLTRLTGNKFRQAFTSFKQDAIKRVLKLYEDKGISTVGRYTLKDATFAYHNMFVRVNDKLHPDFIVKNPYDPSSNLTTGERVWLKTFLFNVNSMRSEASEYTSEEDLINSEIGKALINSGEYFQVPLLRGSFFSKFKEHSLKSYIKDFTDELMEDARALTEEQKKSVMMGQKEYTQMTNFLMIDQTTRMQYLQEHPAEYWETNLELVEDVMMHAKLRKEIFDKVLPMITTLKQMVYLYGWDNNTSFEGLKDQIDRFIRVVIFGEPGPKAQPKLQKFIGGLTSVTRAAMLGFNPNSLVREPIQGVYMMMSRAINKTFGDDGFGVADAAKGWAMVAGNTGTTLSDNFSLVELLNHYYGMTQMDPASLAYQLNSDNKGYKGFLRRGPYWSTSAPDFLNRMTFLCAQMIHDGCMNAHSEVDGKLVYDWTKDKRYELVASKSKGHPLYNKQLARYIAAVNKFNAEGVPIELDLENPKPLPAAYTNSEADSIKSGANSLFGYMERQDAMTLRSMLFGRLMSQFQMYWSATRERWWHKGTIVNTKGQWIHRTDDDGNKLYYRIEYDEEGNMEMVETTENTGIPVQEYTGRFIEGMANSTVWLMKYLWDTKVKHVDPEDISGMEHFNYRMRNMRTLFSDIAWKALLYLVFRLIWSTLSDNDAKNVPYLQQKLLNQALIRSTDELSPWAALGPIFTPRTPVIEMLSSLSTSIERVANDPTRLGHEIKRNIQGVRLASEMWDIFEDEE